MKARPTKQGLHIPGLKRVRECKCRAIEVLTERAGAGQETSGDLQKTETPGVAFDLSPDSPPPLAIVRRLMIRSPTLDRPKAEFCGFAQGDGLLTPPDFVSMIGTLFPIAPCGRSSL